MFRIVAHRSARSIFGAKEAYFKENGKIMEWGPLQREKAEAYVKHLNENKGSKNIWYTLEWRP